MASEKDKMYLGLWIFAGVAMLMYNQFGTIEWIDATSIVNATWAQNTGLTVAGANKAFFIGLIFLAGLLLTLAVKKMGDKY